MALVAAMAPKSNGSSTMGMKKSVVATTAWCSLICQTAASSAVSMPTSSSFGSTPVPDLAMICDSTAGAILQPQPPPWLNEVSRSAARSGAFMGLREAGYLADERVRDAVGRAAGGVADAGSDILPARRFAAARACSIAT